MEINQLLSLYGKKFKDIKIKSPFLDAEILLSFILKKPREYILSHGKKKLTKLQTTRYKLLTKKRLQGWSVAHLIGKKEFYGLDFFVNKYTLIPRPETELMVEEAIIASQNLLKDPRGFILIDIGTGSGNIIISLIKSLKIKSKLKIKNKKFYAVDISKKALEIAQKNAKIYKVDKDIKFFQGNLLEPIIKLLLITNYSLPTIILANLPYLTPRQIKNSTSIQKEPKSALAAGDNGLKYYHELFNQIKKNKKLFISYYILCEIDPSQNKSIKLLAKKYFSNCEVDIKKDLSGKNRLAIIEINI